MLYLLAAPIGNISDISIRALEILESCKEILCEDTRVTKKLINLLYSRGYIKKIDFNYTSLHSHNEISRIYALPKDYFLNDVIYMSDAGTPCISDPGVKLIQFMQQNKLPYTILPGANSAISAMALSGFEGGFRFLEFIPHKLQDRIKFINFALDSTLNTIFFESTHRILDTMELLNKFSPQRRIFLVKEMTKLHEKFYFGSVNEVYSELKNKNINGEWVVIVSSGKIKQKSLNINDINELSLPPKIKAKLYSKLTDKSIQDCYNEIINKTNERK
ncbi:16S rRNA (cytidine(1402)-2'-O)-methyltransferase [Helicobacter sp. MIT 14-3879]|uniref:16S rRNA (cytidine(1402)-2'-O)-methyltransferase n=1 Tax=Helicobacter sp. MIT 14-3879 TaxID=2040649 RepID=UPI0015F151E1|nr:16S rRNA (cytidine(1402)-2'-O)-methyltransferase [Helicobacter sp. MIT 14-3879]